MSENKKKRWATINYPHIEGDKIYYLVRGRGTALKLMYEYKDNKAGKLIPTPSFIIQSIFSALIGILFIAWDYEIITGGYIRENMVVLILCSIGTLFFLFFAPIMIKSCRKTCNDFLQGKKGWKKYLDMELERIKNEEQEK